MKKSESNHSINQSWMVRTHVMFMKNSFEVYHISTTLSVTKESSMTEELDL